MATAAASCSRISARMKACAARRSGPPSQKMTDRCSDRIAAAPIGQPPTVPVRDTAFSPSALKNLCPSILRACAAIRCSSVTNQQGRSWWYPAHRIPRSTASFSPSIEIPRTFIIASSAQVSGITKRGQRARWAAFSGSGRVGDVGAGGGGLGIADGGSLKRKRGALACFGSNGRSGPRSRTLSPAAASTSSRLHPVQHFKAIHESRPRNTLSEGRRSPCL
jgi:hypothetical protein